MAEEWRLIVEGNGVRVGSGMDLPGDVRATVTRLLSADQKLQPVVRAILVERAVSDPGGFRHTPRATSLTYSFERCSTDG